MALVVSSLAQSLANDWLVPEGGSYPESADESGQNFAQAVATWFGQAQANGIPCATASARQSQLAQLAATAFRAEDASAAGQLLATAMLGYIAGQSFGPGTAAPPIAFSAGAAAFIAVFSDLEMDNDARAQQIASGCQAMASSTIVSFTFPPYAATVV